MKKLIGWVLWNEKYNITATTGNGRSVLYSTEGYAKSAKTQSWWKRDDNVVPRPVYVEEVE